jgi:hypothetical protein
VTIPLCPLSFGFVAPSPDEHANHARANRKYIEVDEVGTGESKRMPMALPCPVLRIRKHAARAGGTGSAVGSSAIAGAAAILLEFVSKGRATAKK